MLYHFELQMAGAILLTAMLIGGVYLWIKRRRVQDDDTFDDTFDDTSNDKTTSNDKMI